MRALTTNAMTIGLFGQTPIDNTGGRIVIDTGASLFAPNTVITGGEVSGGGDFSVGGRTTLEGGIVFDGIRIALGGTDNLIVRDTLTTNAAITMAGAGTHAQKALMTIDGDVTFTGGGVVQALTAQENFIPGGGGHLTIDEDFAMKVTPGSRLYTDVSITARGRVETHGLMQLFGPSPLTTSDTTLIAGTGDIQLTGNALTNRGTIAPGFGPSGLTVRADVSNHPTSVLDIELAGTEKFTGYDVLSSYSYGADGTLEVSLIDGFTPELDDVFDIYDGVIFGLFAVLDLPDLPPGRV